jgi:hypothetical protein
MMNLGRETWRVGRYTQIFWRTRSSGGIGHGGIEVISWAPTSLETSKFHDEASNVPSSLSTASSTSVGIGRCVAWPQIVLIGPT